MLSGLAWPSAPTDPVERLEARLGLHETHAQQADADHRQSVRDDGLRPAEEPRRLRAARQLSRRRDRHRGQGSRHRAVPRGGARGLRRRRRLRRRRHGQRGRQRPRRARHPAQLPARRPHERLLPDARDPDRRRRRDRAPAAPRRRLAAAPGRPRRGSTTATSSSPPASASTPASSSVSTPTRGSRPGSGEWYYTWTGVQTFTRRYLLRPPRLEVELGGESVTGVTAIVQNAAPYTYFGNRPVEIGEGADARERRPRRRRARAGQPDRHPHESSGARCTRAPASAATARCIRSAAASGLRVRSLDDRAAAAAGRRRLHRRGPRGATSAVMPRRHPRRGS